jgi:ribosomal protein L11 methyltransferase
MQNHEDWQQFVMDIGSLEPQLLEDIFNRHGAHAVTLTDAGDEPLLEPGPGETPLWANTRISGLFAADAELESLQEDIASSFSLDSLPGFRIEDLAGRDWEREWLKDFQPMAFGQNLWVCPGDQAVEANDAVVIKLDPGLAFGTGTHATTALCLEWLDGRGLRGKKVLDFGCGSGILSIAALLLGAKSATAVDIDSQAIVATQRNAERNQVAERVITALDAQSIGDRFDLVVANVLAGPLVENATYICERLKRGGYVALSGILADQADDVVSAYSQWIQFEPLATKDGWVLICGTRI